MNPRTPSRSIPATVTALVVALVAILPAGCAEPTEAELRYIDELRNRVPRMSVAVADDDTLLAAGRAVCAGEPSPELDRIVALDVDRQVVVEVATVTICPAR